MYRTILLSLTMFLALGFRPAAQQSESDLDRALALDQLGRSQYELQNFPAALENLERARMIYEQLHDDARLAGTWTTTGIIQRAQGDYNHAFESYRKAETLLERTASKVELARLANSMCLLLRNQGNYSLALEYGQRSFKLAEEAGDRLLMAHATTNSGSVYRDQNRYDLAVETYRKASAMYDELGNKDFVAGAQMNIGVVYKWMGKYDLALEFYRNSLKFADSSNRTELAAGLHGNIGAVYALQRDFPKALENFQQSLAFYEGSGRRSIAAGILNDIGRVYYEQKNYSQALAFAGRAVSLVDVPNSELFAEIDELTAKTQFALGNHRAARDAWEHEIQIFETMRASAAGGEQDRERLLENRISPWRGMVQLLAKENQPLDALTYAEQARARVLLDVLQGGRLDIRRAMTAAEQENERRLRGELTAINTSISAAVQSNKPNPRRIEELQSQLTKARLAYETFRIDLYTRHPELRVQRGDAPTVTLPELASLLPTSNTAVLEYMVTDDTTFLFVVTKAAANDDAKVRLISLPISRAELVKQAEALRRQLGERDLGFRASARSLYDVLVKPARAELSGKSDLVIVPDDDLWELPFQALVAENGRYLLETSSVSYAPSLTVLREMRKNRKTRTMDSNGSTLLAFGNPDVAARTAERSALTLRGARLQPLPEAEQEVQALLRLYGSAHGKIYVRSEAREDRAKAEAAQARILHFATHGTLNNSSPMYSNLVLAQGSRDEDGLLEAWEMMQMDLNADLAVLSACETARGRYGAGEGMIGLTWALFVAGVPSTVVSQWQVESRSTRDLMLEFHRNLRSGSRSKAQALRQAAVGLMKNQETSHPFYWAGFVLVGDGQ